jgi:hypothetical protein
MLRIARSVRRRTDRPAQRSHDAAMDKRPHRVAGGDVEPAIDLQSWDAEGGALPVTTQVRGNTASALAAVERQLLGRLGDALVAEWNNLPMPLQRAIYDRSVRSTTTGDPAALKRRMACFLHDHKDSRLRQENTTQR